MEYFDDRKGDRAAVLKIDTERRNIVISRRKLIEEERESAKKRLLETEHAMREKQTS